MNHLNKTKIYTVAIVLMLLLISINLIVYSFKPYTDDYYKEEFSKNYKVYSLSLPNKLESIMFKRWCD